MSAGNAFFAACLLTAGCAVLSGCAVKPGPPPAPKPAAVAAIQVDPALELLRYSHALTNASPTERLDMLRKARAAYEKHVSPESVARLALAYGQPGQRGYAPSNGERYAEKALAIGEDYWSEAAAAYLRQFAMLCGDNTDVRKVLDAEREHTRKLEQRLTQARKKLRAITRIEAELSESRE